MRMDSQHKRSWLAAMILPLLIVLSASPAFGLDDKPVGPASPSAVVQTVATSSTPTPADTSGSSVFSGAMGKLPNVTSRENLSSAMQIVVLLTVLSLAPAILVMMTSFTRIIIVLSLLRQGAGNAAASAQPGADRPGDVHDVSRDGPNLAARE